ncbi:MAG TPA: glycosyltransferase 87 family protein [Solirubrobacteraceae bacterium]|nr:glycosyltransferase 87 family protein [Solirubrobacteraceae bacterium]
MTHSPLNPASATAPSSPPGAAPPPSTTDAPAFAPGRETGARPGRARPLAGSGLGLPIALLVGMVGATTLIVLDAAAGHSGVIPRQPGIANYLNGVGERLGYDTFLLAMLGMTVCYAGIVALARRLTTRFAVGAIVLLHAIVFAGPILLSQDPFSYVAYARMGVLHGINPYLHGPYAAPHDPIFHFVGPDWRSTATVYGPLFTLASYPLAPLGVNGALWGLKLFAVAASLGTVWLVWRCARLLGRDPLVPALLLGLNPILLIYDVGGAHNDLEMGFLMMLGVWLTLRGRDAVGAASVVAGAAVKATAVAVLPFMLLARRQVGLLTGTLIAGSITAVVAFAVFGAHSLDFVSALQKQQSFVSTDSFPNEVAHLFGLAGVFPSDRIFLRLGAAAVVIYLLWRVWRGYDWISGATWALLAVAVSTTWLLAWYVMWSLPLAVIARDRRALYGALAVTGLFFVHQMSPLFTPV